MADVSIEQIIHSAWSSAGVAAPESAVQEIMLLITGKGTACMLLPAHLSCLTL